MNQLLLLVTYHTRTGARADFLRAMETSGILETIRKEAGCLRYDYFLSADDPEAILLVEKWESEEKQLLHLQTPHMAQFRADIKEIYVKETTLEKISL